MNEKISLIIPLKNEEDSVNILLTSILEQSYQPAEIILVDGGSTDKTVQLIRERTGNDSRFRLINAGKATPGKGRNIGAAHATSEWIAFTDAGIKLDAHWLKNLVTIVHKHPDADVVYGNFSPEVKNFFDKCAVIAYAPAQTRDNIRERFIASSMMKKAIWKQVNGFPDWRAAEDLVFMETIAASGANIYSAPDATLTWQLRPDVQSTFKRFSTYSKYNVWAGRQSRWHYGMMRQYVIMLIPVLLAIFHSVYWLWALPVWMAARTVKRILLHRYEFGRRQLFDPITFLGVMLMIYIIDIATFSGWITAIFTKNKLADAPQHV